MHKTLFSPIIESDPNIIKVMKNFYQKYVNSSYIESESFTEIQSYLKPFGTFPLQTSNWTENDLNFAKYRQLYEVYTFSHKQFKAAIKTPQRFEICNGSLNSLIPIPARAMFARLKVLVQQQKHTLNWRSEIMV